MSTRADAKIYQAEVNIAILSDDVHDLWMRGLRAPESEAPVVGLVGAKDHDRVV